MCGSPSGGSTHTLGISSEGTLHKITSCLGRFTSRFHSSADSTDDIKETNCQTFDLETGSLLGSDPAGFCIATADGAQVIRITDRGFAISGADQAFELSAEPPHLNRGGRPALAANYRFLLERADDNSVRVWDLEKRAEACILQEKRIWSLGLPAEGAYFATSGDRITIWNAQNPCTPKSELILEMSLSSLSITDDAGHLTGISDGAIYLWNTRRNTVCRYTGDGEFTSCTISSDAKFVVAGDRRGQIHLLELRDSLRTSKPRSCPSLQLKPKRSMHLAKSIPNRLR